MKNLDKIKNILKEEFGNTINLAYTHFAVYKPTNKIVNGWEYKGLDYEDIKEYSSQDIMDMFPDYKLSNFKILTRRGLELQGVDPFDIKSWNVNDLDESVFKNEHLMKEDGGYPAGAEFDSNAPWNDNGNNIVYDLDEMEFKHFNYTKEALGLSDGDRIDINTINLNGLQNIVISINQYMVVEEGPEDKYYTYDGVMNITLTEVLTTILKRNPEVQNESNIQNLFRYLMAAEYTEDVLDEIEPLEDLIFDLIAQYIIIQYGDDATR